MHDVGKIGIPDAILLKPGKLDRDEYILVQQHGSLSGKILQKMKKYNYLAPIVRHHHEDYSGNGYPDGLKAEEIPVGSRILSIVDVFDALTSKRIYRGSMKIEKALEIMDNMQKTLKFDPKFYEIFRSNIDKFILTMNGFKNTQDVIEELQELDFLRNNFFFSDPLTKLLNRQAMLTILKQCSFNDLNITLAKLNIQNFRAYNKLYGSEKGDKLLFSVATHLKDGLKARVNIKEPKNNDMFLFRPYADVYVLLHVSKKVDFIAYKIDIILEKIQDKLGINIIYEMVADGKILSRNIEKQISSLL